MNIFIKEQLINKNYNLTTNAGTILMGKIKKLKLQSRFGGYKNYRSITSGSIKKLKLEPNGNNSRKQWNI